MATFIKYFTNIIQNRIISYVTRKLIYITSKSSETHWQFSQNVCNINLGLIYLRSISFSVLI